MGKAIMILGTASGVGKSTLATGLCRILKQDGFKVAPFKAQNMSFNIHTLPNGQQMARSQAIAAFACGIKPHPTMNPILLIPKGVSGCEVIFHGKSIGFLREFEYNEMTAESFEEILAAYNQLSSNYDVVIIEGAGSPVELNLKKNDVANMSLAKRIGCPVILVADISRGGVFASVYGTLMLLDEMERQMIKGIVINKFCGLIKYFQSGREVMESISQKPLLGIVPYSQIKIEDEDSLTDGQEMKTKENLQNDLLDKITYGEYMEKQFDLLAEIIRKNLDIRQIINIIGRQTR